MQYNIYIELLNFKTSGRIITLFRDALEITFALYSSLNLNRGKEERWAEKADVRNCYYVYTK